MSNFIQKTFLQVRSPVFQFKRFRGKINIQRPRAPHYERARVIAVTTPLYREPIKNKNCFQKSVAKVVRDPTQNPYNAIIAKEVFNWLNQSKTVGIFHLNSITQDDLFTVRVALHKQNLHLKSYGKSIINLAVQNTKFEAIEPLFDASHCIVFSSEDKVSQLIKLTKKVPQMILMAGIVKDRFMSRNEFMNYATLPDLQTVQAQFVMTLNSAAGQMVENLETHQKLLCNALDAYAKTGENGNENVTTSSENSEAN